MDFRGTHTALVTPFLDDAQQAIDWNAYDALIEAQVAGGVRGLVVSGTTGESPALSRSEQIELFSHTVKQAKGRALVIAGTGSNSTSHTIELSVAAEKAGVDAVMIVVPYYNKPTQDGLVAHFCAAAAAVKCPVIVYNVPARTGIDLSADALVQICEKAKNVLACKEATANVLRGQELARRLGDRLTILCGDDALTLPMISVGAQGVISVTSNLLPAEVSAATRAGLDGNFELARKLHFALLPVHEVMFVEANPSPVKFALASQKKMKNVVRGPLVSVGEASAKKITSALDAYSARPKVTVVPGKIRLGVVGASGRMGEAILRIARADHLNFEVVCEISEGADFGAIARAQASVVIDFSRPEATLALASIAATSGAALVVGTTGLDATAEKALVMASEKIAVLAATNMSVGVHVLGVLAERAAQMLGEDVDIEIVETHHKRKVDSPSGTALTLGKNLQEARHRLTHLVNGREGNVGPRSPHEIGMHAVRGGDVIGDHTVHFFGQGERIELTHRATSRDLFASGALRAARWVATKSPGFYGMRDMMNEII